MKLLPSFVTFLRAHPAPVVRLLQLSLEGWALRPVPALLPIPIRIDCGARNAIEHRRRRGA